jgi:hypothetical protein
MEAICTTCNGAFEKRKADYNRTEREGRRHFCSRRCAAAKSPSALNPPIKPENLRPRRVDEYSPFRHHLSRCRRRKHEVTITVQDLKQIWDNQKGICPLTGWELRMASSSKWDGVRCTPRSASLDRIDSSLGYVPGNVRWISVMANYAKAAWSDEDLVAFAKAVVSVH